MCRGKNEVLRCFLMTFSVLGMIECVVHSYLIGYPDGTAPGIATDILYCAVLFSAAFCGFVIFCEEKIIIVMVYGGLIIVLIILDLLSIISQRGQMTGKNLVELAWEEKKVHSELMDDLQRKYRCCGKDSADDYPNLYDRPIPSSCYAGNAKEPFEKGCFTEVKDINFSLLYWIVLLFQMLWLGFACYYFWHVRKQQLANNQPRRPSRA